MPPILHDNGRSYMSASDIANSVLPTILSDINTNIAILNAMTPPPKDMIDKYNILTGRATDIQANIATYTLITIGPAISSIQSDLTALDVQVKRMQRKGGAGLIGDIYEEIQDINTNLFILASTLVGMLFGGIIGSNWYVSKATASPAVSSIPRAVYVIYYFVYGAVLFPLVLLYGALWDTPAWRAVIIPLWEVPTGLFNPLVSYRSKTDVSSYTAGKTLLRFASAILLVCLAFTIYLINFNA